MASLARPGGDPTGLTTLGIDLVGKRLELLKEAFPLVKRLAFLAARSPEHDRSADEKAGRLGMQMLPARVTRAENLPTAMRSLPSADAWFVGAEVIYFVNRRTIIDLVAEQRKPAMYPSTFFVDAGGLMSYSVAQLGQYRRVAALVDRILRGTKPADLPVEQPTEFELAINIKDANALGLPIPPSFLVRADRRPVTSLTRGTVQNRRDSCSATVVTALRARRLLRASHRSGVEIMDASLLLRTSTWLLVAAAVGGLSMAYVRFARNANPPSWLAMAHGLLAAAGVTLLAYASLAVGIPTLANWGLVLLLIAAAGGVVMNLAYHLKNLMLPAWLVVVHALLAAAGFLMLVVVAVRS